MTTLTFDPQLAAKIGLNEAIFISQLQYWSKKPNIGKMHNGRKYVRNGLQDWHENFPFWSLSTLRRTIKAVTESEYVFAENLNQRPGDQTLWYAVNEGMVPHVQIEQMGVSERTDGGVNVNTYPVQDEQMVCSERTDGVFQFEQFIYKDYTKITSKTTGEKYGTPPPPDPWEGDGDDVAFKLHQDAIRFSESWCKLTHQRMPYLYGDETADRKAMSALCFRPLR